MFSGVQACAPKQVANICYTGTIELERFNRRSTGWCSSQNHRIVVIPGEMIQPVVFPGMEQRSTSVFGRIERLNFIVLVAIATAARVGQIF